MTRLEARQVALAPLDPRLVGREIDQPRPGEISDGPTLPLMGWVIGRTVRTVAVELLHEGRVVRQILLDHPRPDLKVAFPEVADAEQGGFYTTIETVCLGEVELALQAVLADQERVPIATLRLAHRWPFPRGMTDHAAGQVLLYHRVAASDRDPWELSVSPAHFEEHLEVLRRDWHPLPLPEAVRAIRDGGLPDRSVVVTFDDGYSDNLLAGVPALERQDVPGALFCSTGYLDDSRGFWWDDLERLLLNAETLPPRLEIDVRGVHFEHDANVSPEVGRAGSVNSRSWDPRTGPEELYHQLWTWLRPLLQAERSDALDQIAAWAGGHRLARDDRPLTTAELIELGSHPLMSVGAHTVTHAQLSALTPAMQRLEIRDCASFLDEVLGQRPYAFAYPFGGPGDVNEASTRLVAENGFRAAFTAAPGTGTGNDDPFLIPRRAVPDMDGDRFAQWLKPALETGAVEGTDAVAGSSFR